MSDSPVKDRKVIPFKGPHTEALKAREIKAATAMGTMGFVLLLIAGLNISLFQVQNENIQQEKIQRSLASTMPQEHTQRLASPQPAPTPWKHDLQKINKEIITQEAQKPSMTDSMAFGSLAGHYDIKTENGHVKEIRLSPSSKVASIIRDRFEFIENFASALAPGLSSIRKDSVVRTKNNKKEVYLVNSAQGESRIEFTMDKNNQLLSLTVDPLADF